MKPNQENWSEEKKAKYQQHLARRAKVKAEADAKAACIANDPYEAMYAHIEPLGDRLMSPGLNLAKINLDAVKKLGEEEE
jgi:hypothetical protein